MFSDPAAGTSQDWYKSARARTAYTLELRDGGYVFLLPPDQIEDSGSEVWAMWRSMLDAILV